MIYKIEQFYDSGNRYACHNYSNGSKRMDHYNMEKRWDIYSPHTCPYFLITCTSLDWDRSIDRQFQSTWPPVGQHALLIHLLPGQNFEHLTSPANGGGAGDIRSWFCWHMKAVCFTSPNRSQLFRSSKLWSILNSYRNILTTSFQQCSKPSISGKPFV